MNQTWNQLLVTKSPVSTAEWAPYCKLWDFRGENARKAGIFSIPKSQGSPRGLFKRRGAGDRFQYLRRDPRPFGRRRVADDDHGVRLVREAIEEAGHGYCAIDMGSLGRLPEPYGDMPFEEAVQQYQEAFLAGIQAGGDLILIETMTDLLETRAAVLAAKEAMEACDKTAPFVSLTFEEQGRLLSGADIPGNGRYAPRLACGRDWTELRP